MTQTRKEALTDLLAKLELNEAPHWRTAARAIRLHPDDRHLKVIDAFDGSLDAAKALHEAVLPRHYAQVHMWPVPEMCRVDIGGGHTGRDDNPARAWLIAILKALLAQEPDPMTRLTDPVERMNYDDDGYLDEVVTAGGAHLEKMRGKRGGKGWFLSCLRADGSEVAIWIEGSVTLVEERPAP